MLIFLEINECFVNIFTYLMVFQVLCFQIRDHMTVSEQAYMEAQKYTYKFCSYFEQLKSHFDACSIEN